MADDGPNMLQQMAEIERKLNPNQSPSFMAQIQSRSVFDQLQSSLAEYHGSIAACFPACMNRENMRFGIERYLPPAANAQRSEKDVICMSVCTKKHRDALRHCRRAAETRDLKQDSDAAAILSRPPRP